MFNNRENLETIKNLELELKALKEAKYDSDLAFERKIETLNYENKKLIKQNEELNTYGLETAKTTIADLKREIKELKSGKAELDLKIAKNEIEVLKNELELKNNLIEQLSNLPDVKRMIDNVADLRIPAIDEMKELFKLFKNEELIAVVKDLKDLPKNVSEAIYRYHSVDRRMY